MFYMKKIQTIVKQYPLEQMRVGTEGPWPFEDKFTNQMTLSKMIHDSVAKIAELKDVTLFDSYRAFYKNMVQFYKLG